MKRFLLASAALAVVSATSPARAEMAFPKMYAFLYDIVQRSNHPNPPHFECDYTARECERGYTMRGGGWQVFELIDDKDRTTVLGHFACYINSVAICFNFDTGVRRITMNDGVYEMAIDGQDRAGQPDLGLPRNFKSFKVK
jgi:hypothetical protein